MCAVFPLCAGFNQDGTTCNIYENFQGIVGPPLGAGQEHVTVFAKYELPRGEIKISNLGFQNLELDLEVKLQD